MVKVLIVDDHAVVREGLKRFLAEMAEPMVAGEARSGNEALNMIKNQDWDLVLLDIAMPGANGVDILKHIKQAKPDLPVLIFSMFSEDEYAIATLNAGAAGYVSKDSAPEELLNAIHRVMQGARYASPALTEKLLQQLNPQRKKMLHERLSQREYQVLLLISKGKQLSQVAEQLHLSPKTVSTYRARILEKIGVANNAELTRYVIENHLET